VSSQCQSSAGFIIATGGSPRERVLRHDSLTTLEVNSWGLDKTVLAECGADCPDPSNFGTAATIHTLKTYPNIPFGFVDSATDSTISLFFGFGGNNCTAGVAPLAPATYTMGLLDTRMKLAAYSNFGGFIFPGSVHTSIGGATLDTVAGNTADGGTILLSDWITTLINKGTVSNVGP
jgi:hypothetical protein